MKPQRKAAGRGDGATAIKTPYLRSHFTIGAARLLDRLEGVKQTGADRWIARCPAHADKRPSLNIRETDDGTVLVRCFAGCGAEAIVQAVGLELRNLFPEKPNTDYTRRSVRPWSAIDLLRVCANEVLLVAIAAQDMVAGIPIDADRVTDAARRLQDAVDLAGARS